MKNKYVVAYISFFDNELTQEVIEATCVEEAMIKKMFGLGFEFELDEFYNEEQLKRMAFDSDSMISAFKIPT